MSLTEGIGRVRSQRRVIGEDVRVADQLLEPNGKVVWQIQRDAPVLAGRSDSANRRIRVAPSRSCSIDVA